MLVKDLKKVLKENYENDIKRELRDALIQLKIGGQQELSTIAVLRDFKAKGMQISIMELINLLKDDPMIQDVNRDKIVFKSEIPEPGAEGEQKEITDEERRNTLKSMSRRALSKRFKVRR